MSIALKARINELTERVEKLEAFTQSIHRTMLWMPECSRCNSNKNVARIGEEPDAEYRCKKCKNKWAGLY